MGSEDDSGKAGVAMTGGALFLEERARDLVEAFGSLALDRTAEDFFFARPLECEGEVCVSS